MSFLFGQQPWKSLVEDRSPKVEGAWIWLIHIERFWISSLKTFSYYSSAYMSLYRSGFSIERKTIKRLILRNWLMQSWGLASLKSVGQASRLEIQPGVDIGVLRQFPFWKTYSCSRLDWASCQGYYPLLKVNWLEVLTILTKYLHSDTYLYILWLNHQVVQPSQVNTENEPSQ